jgi:endoplasmic reticulum chaperone BiP
MKMIAQSFAVIIFVLFFVFKTTVPISPVMGIDFGTSYSSVVISRDGENFEIVLNDQGNTQTPTMFGIDKNDRYIFGEAAKSEYVDNPSSVIRSIKRILGKEFSDEVVQSEIKRRHANIFDNHKKPYLKIRKEQFSVATVVGHILGNLKEMGEKYIGQTIDKVIISVPTYADVSQRKSTIQAANMAGFPSANLVDEPIAAALASGLNLHQRDNKYLFIFDFGGGNQCNQNIFMFRNS